MGRLRSEGRCRSQQHIINGFSSLECAKLLLGRFNFVNLNLPGGSPLVEWSENLAGAFGLFKQWTSEMLQHFFAGKEKTENNKLCEASF